MSTKKVITFDTNAFEVQNNLIVEGKEAINKPLHEMMAEMLVPLKLTTNKEMRDFLLNPEAFIKAELAKKVEPQTILGIKLSRNKLVDQMDLDFTYINTLAKDCNSYLSYLHYYQLKNGKVEINEKEVEKLKDRFSTIATTPDQLKMIDAHEKAALALTEFNAALRKAMGNNVALDNDLSFRYYFIEKDGVFSVKEYFYMLHKGTLYDVEHGLDK